MERLKVGIIGCGGIANKKHLPALKKLMRTDVVAFCDIVEERAIETAGKFGTKDARIYTDYKKLLEEQLDIVYVCTPNCEHCRMSVDALNSGKHVMCEKPMSISYAEGKKMLDASLKNHKLLTIGYQHRYRKDSQYLKAEIEKDALGEIYFARAQSIRRRGVPTWGVFIEEDKQGGGALIDIGTHALDLALWLMNNYEPLYVVGKTYKKFRFQTKTANRTGDWDPNKFTVEDSAFGYVFMKNGALVSIESSWALNTLFGGEAIVTLAGDNAGADMLDGLRVNGVKNNCMYIERPELAKNKIDFESKVEFTPSVLEQISFLDAVEGKGELLVKPEQALIITQILEGIYKSEQLGQPVFF